MSATTTTTTATTTYENISYPPTDCLVLRIVEHDIETYQVDTTMYVLYDSNYETFVVRAKREGEWTTHSYYCTGVSDLADFISTVICRKNSWSYTLYTVEHLGNNSDDITFEFLENKVSKETELCGYDGLTYKGKTLKKMLGILRNVYNYY